METNEILNQKQRDGTYLRAQQILKSTLDWLDEKKCAHLISPQLLDRYAMAAARWEHCEQMVSSVGYLARDSTTGKTVESPYVAMSQTYMKQANSMWNEIFHIANKNCTKKNDANDMFEKLLRNRDEN